MARYKCQDCGNIFDEDEVARWEEDRGEFWGFPCSESMTGCPLCYGAFEEYRENEESEEEDEDYT